MSCRTSSYRSSIERATRLPRLPFRCPGGHQTFKFKGSELFRQLVASEQQLPPVLTLGLAVLDAGLDPLELPAEPCPAQLDHAGERMGVLDRSRLDRELAQQPP